MDPQPFLDISRNFYAPYGIRSAVQWYSFYLQRYVAHVRRRADGRRRRSRWPAAGTPSSTNGRSGWGGVPVVSTSAGGRGGRT